MSRLVYAAGPISGLFYGEATNWRELAANVLGKDGITLLSPMRHKDYLVKKRAPLAGEYHENPLSTGKGITTRDRWDVQRCDVVLVNLTGAQQVSVGTVIELGWADAARKPIVLAMEEVNVHQHPMVREVAGFVVPTLEEALAIVRALLVP